MQNVLTVFFIVNQIRCPEAAEVIITDFYKTLVAPVYEIL